MQFHDKAAYVWMGILPLKKRVNHDKCSFTTKQRMFWVFAIDEPGSSVRALFATLAPLGIFSGEGSLIQMIDLDPKWLMIIQVDFII